MHYKTIPEPGYKCASSELTKEQFFKKLKDQF